MNFIKNKLGIWFFVVLLAILLILLFTLFLNKKEVQTYTVEKADFEENLIVSGKVIPAQEVDLSFEVVGKVIYANLEIGDLVTAGDVLVTLDNSDILNQITESEASLESQLAKLNEVKSQEDLLDKTKLENKKTELINVFKKAYTVSDDVIRNKVDIFIENPDGRFPDFSKSLSNYFLREDINKKRSEIGSMLKDWLVFNSELSIEKIQINDSDVVINNLKDIESILKLISSGAVDFKTTNTITQNQIDSYIANISASRNSITNLILEVNQITESVRGITAEIPILEASVKQSEAQLKRLNDNLSKYRIVAPFTGVITDKKIEVGEIAQIGTSAASIISDHALEIETFIPEIKIQGVSIGNNGSAILDAFGKDKSFPVKVSHIDPRETEKDNIVTYRTLIEFDQAPEGVRPGMTVEVNIIKESIDDVILVPKHMLGTNDIGYFVLLKNGEQRNVEVGPTDGKGNIVVTAGLEAGEEIVVPNGQK